jgi:hypothetical protein
MKKALFLFCVALGASHHLVAQSSVDYSGKTLYTAARQDTKQSAIFNDDLKKPADDLTLTSDYAKPNTTAVTNPGKTASASELAAESDAKKFKLSHSLLKKFKNEHFSYTSDYFKPARHHVTDASMLSDSTYVKTFKYKAYLEAKKARLNPVGHAIGTAFAVVATTAIIAAGVYEVGQM